MKFKKTLALWKEDCDKPWQHIKKQRRHFANKGPYSQSYGFSSSYVWMRELDHKEGWVLKNWCFRIVVLEKTESSLDCNRSNQSILKEISPEYSLERLMLNWSSNTLATWCEEPTHWERPWCWERLKARWEGDNRRWDGWMASPIQWTWIWVTPGVGDGQGGLACCNPWGRE